MNDTPQQSRKTENSTAPAAAPAPHLLAQIPIALRWRDLDAFNHVNNATFLGYLEEARLQWLSQIEGEWATDAYMPVLAAVTVNFRRQLEWPGDIVVELYCERVGGSSLTLAHRIVDAATRSTLYSDGSSVMVWIEPAGGRSIPLPDVIRRACIPPPQVS